MNKTKNLYGSFEKSYSDKKEKKERKNKETPNEYKSNGSLLKGVPTNNTEGDADSIDEYTQDELPEFFQDYSEKLIGVYIYSDKCQPCKKIFDPALKDFLSVMKNPKFKLIKLNCVKNLDFCKSFKVDAVPTVLFFKGGKLIKDIPGKENVTHTGACIKNFQECLENVAEYLGM